MMEALEVIGAFGKLAGGMIATFIVLGLCVGIRNELKGLFHRPKLPKRLTRF
jgi:hypothetical protein